MNLWKESNDSKDSHFFMERNALSDPPEVLNTYPYAPSRGRIVGNQSGILFSLVKSQISRFSNSKLQIPSYKIDCNSYINYVALIVEEICTKVYKYS